MLPKCILAQKYVHVCLKVISECCAGHPDHTNMVEQCIFRELLAHNKEEAAHMNARIPYKNLYCLNVGF